MITGTPSAEASHDRPLPSPIKKSACSSSLARSCNDRSPVKSSAPCGMVFVNSSSPYCQYRVDAQNAISQRIQMVNQGWPAVRIVPVLTLPGRLRRDANIAISDEPGRVRNHQRRLLLPGRHAELISDGILHVADTRVGRLMVS